MYKVEIGNDNPNIGAKNQSANFCTRGEAHKQFNQWRKWLDADLEYDFCDLLDTWRAENKESGYIVTMNFVNTPEESKCKTCQDIDFDSKS
jgi:hypothetical protein